MGTFFGTILFFLGGEDFAYIIKDSFIRIKVELFRYDLRKLNLYFLEDTKKKKDIRNRKRKANKKREKEKKNRKKKKKNKEKRLKKNEKTKEKC